MSKLLNANFYRLKKSYCFWILLILMAFLGCYMYINNSGFHPERCVNCNNQFGDIFFSYLTLNWILIPIFTSLFIGTEYSDGTIKNKIISGHKRSNIYFSNLITSIIVSFVYSIIYVIFALITSLMLKYSMTIPISKFTELLITYILLNIVFSSLFTLISMTVSNKATASIVSLITVIWSMMIASNLYGKLPSVGENTKMIYETILKIIPFGQAFQIANLTDNYDDFWLFSMVLIIIFNFYGIIMINKKQLS